MFLSAQACKDFTVLNIEFNHVCYLFLCISLYIYEHTALYFLLFIVLLNISPVASPIGFL